MHINDESAAQDMNNSNSFNSNPNPDQFHIKP